MTSDTQRQMLNLLAEIWELSPEVRLGQLMAHLGFLGEGHHNRSLGYIDDDELMSILCLHKAELVARLQDNPDAPLQQSATAPPILGSTGSASPTPASELGR